MRKLVGTLWLVAVAAFVVFAPRIARADAPYVYLLQWGSGGTGNEFLSSPFGVATDASGNVYVSDPGDVSIKKFTSTGAYVTQWGSAGSGDGQFYGLLGIAVDTSGNVYAVDLTNNRIEKFTNAGAYLTQWGSSGTGNGEFAHPHGVATDLVGNVYVADSYNSLIQAFTSSGAYVGQWGAGGGNGGFGYPYGVATDRYGHVYVADTGMNRIQEFTSTGAYVTQWGTYGSGDGEFDQPYGVATDTAGHVFVADFNNNRIQEFTNSGAYLTQWGWTGSGDGQFNQPVGVATDASGNVYVADQGNSRIQKFGPPPCLPIVTTNPKSLVDLVGSSAIFRASATGSSLTFQWRKNGTPIGGAADSTYTILSVAPADSGRYDVVVSNMCGADTSSAATLTIFGSYCFSQVWGTVGSGNGQFNSPEGVATDASGNVYVADVYNSRVQKFTSTGAYITQWGSIGSSNGQFKFPQGICTDAFGNVYIADTYNYRIQLFTSTGAYVKQWGSLGSGNGLFDYPMGVATDVSGNVYVVDNGNNLVQKFTSTGAYITQWGSGGSGNGQFNSPWGVATDAFGNVLVADMGNNRIQVFTGTGTYLTQWGSLGSGNGQLHYPAGVATDASGNVFVAEASNNRIQEFTSTGTYLTQWGLLGSGNGQLNNPSGVATDAFGNVLVADMGNKRIQKFGPCGSNVCAPVPASLVGWWKLDGDASDVLGRYPGAVIGGGGSFVPGEVAQGFHPDIATIVAIPNAPALNPRQFTLDAWVKLDSLPVGNPVVLWKGDSGGLNALSPFALAISGTSQALDHVGRAAVTVGDGVQFQEVDANVLAPVGVWVLLAATADGTHLDLYQDGVLVGSAAQTVTPAPSGYPLQIGGTIALSSPNSFTGTIDEVELHAAAADSQAIRTIFNAGSAGKCAVVAAVAASSPPRALSLTSAPNPSGGRASLSFYVPQPAIAWLDIFDVGGRRVERLVNGRLVVGEQRVEWTGRDAAGRQLGAGIYFARLRVGGAIRTTRLVVLGP